MVERKTLQISQDRAIVVTTEQMADGTWAVVASIKQVAGDTESLTDLPVPEQRFATQADAESFGIAQGQEWIDLNTPRAA
jgi:hypothetical protein